MVAIAPPATTWLIEMSHRDVELVELNMIVDDLQTSTCHEEITGQ